MSSAGGRNVFITGVSSGIGHGLARAYLDCGNRVYGVSRRHPVDLMKKQEFYFAELDLTEAEAVRPAITRLLAGVGRIDLAVLNAGILGGFGDMADADISELKQVMDVNLWANKVVLDALFASGAPVSQVVAVSSGAAVNGNRGWRGYALSKAALNMLTKLYAAERAETHFCALAPGVVDTAMQDQLCGLPEDPRFPSLGVMRSKRHTGEMPKADAAADRLIDAIQRLPGLVTSGAFADIRKL